MQSTKIEPRAPSQITTPIKTKKPRELLALFNKNIQM